MSDELKKEETKDQDAESWMKEQYAKAQKEKARKKNVQNWLNDPDEARKAMKEQIYNEHLKAKLEASPTIADSPELLTEAYLLKLESMKEIEQAKKNGTEKQEQKIDTDPAKVEPHAANPTSDGDSGAFFTDKGLNGKKVSKITADLAKSVGINVF